MKSLCPLFALCLGFATANSFAQNTDQALPKSPVLRRAPAFASWTVTFKYKDEEPRQSQDKTQPLPDRIRSITITKTNKTYWEQTTLRSGRKYEKWIFNNVQLETVPGTSSIVTISPPTKEAPEPEYSDYSKTDFQGLHWVSLDTYQKTESYGGKIVYRFESNQPEGKIVALLSMDAQLPVYFSNGETSGTYTYNPPPSDPLTPPEKFLAVLDTYKKGLEALKYHSSRP